jgi:DNA polymerase
MTQRSLFDDDPPPLVPAEVPGAAAPPAPALPEAGASATTPAERETLMAQVREPALGCTRCPLSETRTHVVFGEGNVASPLVFVGEGPGENEDATGRPFVGRAGKLLDEVLRENGMTRQHVYICNVIKCRAANLEEGRWKNRPPRVEEVEACSAWLRAQLEIIRPLVIVCLGGPAANEIIHRNFRITQERGQWFASTPFAPWVMAAFHPAYVLRLHGPGYDAARASLVGDVANARRKVIEARKQAKATLF